MNYDQLEDFLNRHASEAICPHCKARVIWATTEVGKRIAMNADIVEVLTTNPAGRVRYVQGWTAHNSTCPKGRPYSASALAVAAPSRVESEHPDEQDPDT